MGEYEADCDFCTEVQYQGVLHGLGHTDESGPFSRLIVRDQLVDVIAGLGALRPGYVLIVPRRHVESVGELPASDRAHVFAVAWHMANQIRSAFGSVSALVEHGSSGGGSSRGQACIAHGHMHLMPVEREELLPRFVLPGSSRIDGTGALADAAARRQNYYFCSWNTGPSFLSVNPRIPAQYARRLWAEITGRPDEWDWAMAPHLLNAAATADMLRTSFADTDAPSRHAEQELAETLTAYDLSAAWYADRTRSFPSSSLCGEIDHLMEHTDGVVLDAGSGTGRDSLYMAQRWNRTVIALDASGPMLEQIDPEPRILKIQGDVRDLPLADASVGAVWCSAVLVHLNPANARAALREFFRVLRPGGRVHITLKEGQGHVREPLPFESESVRHFYLYSERETLELVRSAGLRVEDSRVAAGENSTGTVQCWVKVLAVKPS